jgi:hypothetical protein
VIKTNKIIIQLLEFGSVEVVFPFQVGFLTPLNLGASKSRPAQADFFVSASGGI